MKYISFIAAFMMLSILHLNAQTGKVSSKTNIKKGVLKNGLTYYIYNNPSSRGKVSYYLIQNVGAILEDDNENGISHFLEHMCFGGTRNFPGNTIWEMFEEKNLKRCMNANTGIDKTIYHFIDVPTKYAGLCDKCLFILRDWCDGVSFFQEKINTERYVILEEKRTRNTAQWRLNRANTEAILCNSKYVERDIIGTEEVIKNLNREDFLEYYNKWYRTDVQAIVVMGDVDIYETETKIQNLFSTIKPVNNPTERYSVKVPDNKEIIFKQIVDSELQNKEIRIKFRHDYKNDVRSKYINLLISQMVNERVTNILKKNKDSDINYLRIGLQKIAQDYFNYGINLAYKKGKAKEALTLAVGINKNILENGFTEEEYTKSKEGFLNSLKRLNNYYQSIPDKQHFQRIESNFLENEDLLDYATELKVFKKTVKNITLEDLKAAVNDLYSGPNKSIVVIDKDTADLLSKDEVLDIEQNTAPKEYHPTKEEAKEINIEELLTKDIKESEVVKKDKLEIEDATVWTLANGAKVIYKECNANGNVITIHAHSWGGTSLLSREDLYNSNTFSMLLPALGVKNIDKDALDDFMKKNNISSNLAINKSQETLSFSCRYENVEQTFQLLYNLFENPNFYKEEYDNTIKKLKASMENVMNGYEFKLQDTISKLRYGNRYIPLDYDFFNNISVEGVEKVCRDRFSDASDFVFYIIGGIGESGARKLAEKYIGSISSENRKESYKKLVNPFPKGETKLRLKYEMESKKAGITCYLNAQKDLTDQEKICFKLLQFYLKEKVEKVIRFEENGTYGVSVKFYSEANALNNYGINIQFDCDPERAEELNSKLKLTLSAIKEKGMSQTDLDILMKPYKQMPSNNGINKNIGYYLGVLKAYNELNKDLTDPDYNKKLLEGIDLEYMNKILKEFLGKADVLDVIYTSK